LAKIGNLQHEKNIAKTPEHRKKTGFRVVTRRLVGDHCHKSDSDYVGKSCHVNDTVAHGLLCRNRSLSVEKSMRKHFSAAKQYIYQCVLSSTLNSNMSLFLSVFDMEASWFCSLNVANVFVS